MKQILLTQGKVALVDDEDFDRLNAFRWCAQQISGRWYAKRCANYKTIYMHRAILGTAGGLRPDHVDGNGLNNQRSNLRPATQQQNTYNRRANKNNTSGAKGVTWDRDRGKWLAQIQAAGQHIYLGRFSDKDHAARAYAEAATKLHGEFARV